MTVSNHITIARVLLIPVFIGGLMYYKRSIEEGGDVEFYRWLAVISFFTAAVSDGLDGFIARRWNQRSKLGAVLDPIADKALVVSALVCLSLLHLPGFDPIPLWFLILVLSRDAIIVAGCLCLHYARHHIQIAPHWTGKTATCLQMVTISWILLRLDWIPSIYLVWITAAFMVAALGVYIRQGIHSLGEQIP
jgi:CDP-diacylglycerol--glycerol-3-phosphate 3-phosphatidyltransferase